MLGDGDRVAALARLVEGHVIDVGRDDLHFWRLRKVRQQLPDQNRERVGFFAGRTAGDPDAELMVDFAAHESPGQHLFFQVFKGVRIAEETCDVYQKLFEKPVDFLRIVPKPVQIDADVRDLEHLHPALDPSHQRARLIVLEVVARTFEQDLANFHQRGGDLAVDRGGAAVGEKPGQKFGVIEEFLGHLFRQNDVIDSAAVDGSIRHRREFRRFRQLRQRHPAGVADCLHPFGAIAAFARKDNADRVLTLVFGQGAEKDIDDRKEVFALLSMLEVKDPFFHRDDGVGRRMEKRTCLQRFAMADFDDWDISVAAQDFMRQSASGFVQVLEKDERDAILGVQFP